MVVVELGTGNQTNNPVFVCLAKQCNGPLARYLGPAAPDVPYMPTTTLVADSDGHRDILWELAGVSSSMVSIGSSKLTPGVTRAKISAVPGFSIPITVRENFSSTSGGLPT